MKSVTTTPRSFCCQIVFSKINLVKFGLCYGKQGWAEAVETMFLFWTLVHAYGQKVSSPCLRAFMRYWRKYTTRLGKIPIQNCLSEDFCHNFFVPDNLYDNKFGKFFGYTLKFYLESKRKSLKGWPKFPSRFSYGVFEDCDTVIFTIIISFHVHILSDNLHIFGKPCSLGMRFNQTNTGRRMKCLLKPLPKTNSFSPYGRLYQSDLPICHLLSICSVILYLFLNLLRETSWLRHQMNRKRLKCW